MALKKKKPVTREVDEDFNDPEDDEDDEEEEELAATAPAPPKKKAAQRQQTSDEGDSPGKITYQEVAALASFHSARAAELMEILKNIDG